MTISPPLGAETPRLYPSDTPRAVITEVSTIGNLTELELATRDDPATTACFVTLTPRERARLTATLAKHYTHPIQPGRPLGSERDRRSGMTVIGEVGGTLTGNSYLRIGRLEIPSDGGQGWWEQTMHLVLTPGERDTLLKALS